MSKPKMQSKGVYLPESLWGELREVAESSGLSQAWLIQRGVNHSIQWARNLTQGQNPDNDKSQGPGPVPAQGPVPTQAPSKAPANPPATVRGRLHGTDYWFTLEPLLDAYDVPMRAVLANCIPKDDILNLDGEQWVDTVCLSILQTLSKISDNDKALIQSRLNELTKALMP